jgi:hypothetical protein
MEPEPSSRGALNSGLASVDSGLQLNLEIALSGVSAKVEPHGLLQPGRRCVETSGDVIKATFTSPATIVELYFTRGRAGGRVRPLIFLGCGRTDGNKERFNRALAVLLLDGHREGAQIVGNLRIFRRQSHRRCQSRHQPALRRAIRYAFASNPGATTSAFR